MLEHREARRGLVHPRPQRRLPRVGDGVRRHLPPALGPGVGADQAVVGESAQLGVDLAGRGRDPVEAEGHVGALLDLVPRQLVAEREEAEDRVRSHRKVLTHLSVQSSVPNRNSHGGTVNGVAHDHAIEAEGLVKEFGETLAVDDVSFAVPRGTVLGLLGPNGAGKTTTVRMMTTLTRPTRGTARVAGHDVLAEPAAVRRSMGLTGPVGHRRRAADRAGEPLADRQPLRPRQRAPSTASATSCSSGSRSATPRDRVVKTYSGGMRRRLDLAVSLVATPPVLFLDEPTTGLDPRSRVELWDVLRDLVERRHDPAAHHAVPRGGRPARRRHRRHRPRAR